MECDVNSYTTLGVTYFDTADTGIGDKWDQGMPEQQE